MRFRGREAAHQVIGREFLERVEKDLFEYGLIEQKPAFEGQTNCNGYSTKEINRLYYPKYLVRDIMPKMKSHSGAAKRFQENTYW
jgi:hypothetical protein